MLVKVVKDDFAEKLTELAEKRTEMREFNEVLPGLLPSLEVTLSLTSQTHNDSLNHEASATQIHVSYMSAMRQIQPLQFRHATDNAPHPSAVLWF